VDNGMGQPECALVVRAHDDAESRLVTGLGAPQEVRVQIGTQVDFGHGHLIPTALSFCTNYAKDTKPEPRVGFLALFAILV
jgi:hypothetical protein